MCKIITRIHEPCNCKTYEVHVCHMIHINAISFDARTPNLDSNKKKDNPPLPPVGVIALDAKSYNPALFEACPFFSADEPVPRPYSCREHWDMAAWLKNGHVRGDDGFEGEMESFEMRFMAERDGNGNVVRGRDLVDVNVLAKKYMKGNNDKKIVEKTPWWVCLICGRRKKLVT